MYLATKYVLLQTSRPPMCFENRLVTSRSVYNVQIDIGFPTPLGGATTSSARSWLPQVSTLHTRNASRCAKETHTTPKHANVRAVARAGSQLTSVERSSTSVIWKSATYCSLKTRLETKDWQYSTRALRCCCRMSPFTRTCSAAHLANIAMPTT